MTSTLLERPNRVYHVNVYMAMNEKNSVRHNDKLPPDYLGPFSKNFNGQKAEKDAGKTAQFFHSLSRKNRSHSIKALSGVDQRNVRLPEEPMLQNIFPP